jgi:ketosteroid isomerase-like protein
MWKLFFTSLLISVATVGLMADSTSDQIMALDKAWAKAVVENDFPAIEKIVAPGLIYSHSDGAVDSREVYLNRLKKGTSVYQSIDFSKMNVTVFGDTAILNARARFKVLADGKQVDNDLSYTHVYQKQNGTWRMIAHQSAKMTP